MWLTFAVAVAGPPVPSALTAPVGVVGAHEAVTLTFSSPGVSFVDSCAPVEWERREGERWVAVPRDPCPLQKRATKVEESLTLSVPPPEPGEYRALLTWGTGCAEALPLQLGACTKLDFVRSESFRVAAAP